MVWGAATSGGKTVAGIGCLWLHSIGRTPMRRDSRV
jgi:hypothetical protein